MAFLIPDSVLDELTCDICEKYLSVLPIKVFPNRRSVCGRCTKKNPDWTGTNSTYNFIAEKTLFKCVNRFDGCRKLLKYSEVVEHENVCLGRKYSCPLCPESEEISTFLLWKHFQINHKDSVLNHPLISCILNSFSDIRNIFIYRLDDYLFFFYLILNRSENIIKTKVNFIGDEKLASSISYKFNINLLNERLKIGSNNFKCQIHQNDNDGFYKINIKDFNSFINIEIVLNFNERSLINIPINEENLLNSKRNVNKGLLIPKIGEVKSLQNPSNSNEDIIKVSHKNSCLVINRNNDHLNLYENIKFTPLAKSLTLRKLYLKSETTNCSLTECGFGLVKENKVIFPVCINCNFGCVYQIIFSKQYKHSLCYYCIEFLAKEKIINKVDYQSIHLPTIEYFCICNCNKHFPYSSCLDHEWIMKKCKIEQKCFYCDIILSLEELVNHMNIKHDFNGIVETNNFKCELTEGSNFLVLVQDQLVYVETIIDSSDSELYVYLYFNKNIQQNITGLIYNCDQYNAFINILKFENFITLKTIYQNKYYLILISSENI